MRLLLISLLVLAAGPVEARQVTFLTEPEGARIFLEISGKEGGDYLGLSGRPVVLDLTRFQNVPSFDVRFEKEGYLPEFRTVKSHYFDSHDTFPPIGTVVLQSTRARPAWLPLAGLLLGLAGVGLVWRRRPPEATPAAAPLPAGDPLVGSRLGGYKILAVLGSGGSGTVYRGETEEGRQVAVKVVYADRDPRAAETQKREVRAHAGLNHPNIVPLLDWGEQGALLYIVTELMSGGTLRDRITEGGMPLEQAKPIAMALLKGVEAAHRQGLVHRDLKPDNVLFGADDRPRVADFGLVRFEDHASLSTNQGPVGTLAYASPEQIAGEAPDALSDQYSLGVVLFELLAGRPPFEPSSGAALVFRHLSATPPALESLRADLPEGTGAVVARMLSKEKSERFPNLDEVITALGEAWK